MSSIVLFGGTFDPIHIGHLIIAEHVKESIGAGKITFLPTGVPPHKKGVSSSIHRLKMVELAISDNPSFEVSTYELKQKGTNYTYRTVKHFSTKTDQLYFFAGADSLVDLPNWRNPMGILNHCKMIIARRNDIDFQNVFQKFDAENFVMVDTPIVGLSSTEVRKRVAANKSCKYILHPKVEQYIEKEELYIG
ncbi:nicotinate-nucleotide adenylyltransferase [Proteinivorax tanatarense]|uniref:Probable nicotinate-nucleotide adenylyltransferase n=1 Tax=Proteinivorax tanatarense TaxID=1260629 RepID=A0AAU7VIE2_9FIRM